MANYWEYNGTIHIKESPLRGLTGMGGGAVMSSQVSGGGSGPESPWTHDSTYNPVGAGVRIDGGSDIGSSWAHQMTALTFQWEVYISSASSNSWHLQVTPGWTDAGGLLIGIYSNWKVSIAGPSLGGYGFQANDNLPGSSWQTIRYSFGRVDGSNSKQRLYYNGSSQGSTNSGYDQPYITFNTGIWGGAGRQSPNNSFTTAFSGGIRNLKLKDEFDSTF